jgi:ubiquinone/menaquinone biosynthesis C-methylase UbiE
MDSLTQGRILELGFGTGHMLLELLREEHSVVGLDASQQMARITRRRVQRAGFISPVCQGRAQALPFPASTFSAVLSMFPSEYISDPAVLGEVARVLAPGGKLVALLGVIDLQGATQPRNSFVRLVDALVQLLYRLTGESVAAQGPSETPLEDLLGQCGLRGRLETVQLPRARLLRLSATKPRPGA